MDLLLVVIVQIIIIASFISIEAAFNIQLIVVIIKNYSFCGILI